MAFETIILEKGEGIAKITLNRPQALNALNQKMRLELRKALDDIKQEDEVAVVILTGAGKGFCTGLDLKEMAELGKIAEDIIQPQGDVWRGVAGLGKPVIAAVNGFCYTGGFELALSCDMVLASEEAVFADTHARYGVLPSGGTSQRMPRLIGVMRAKEILLGCEPIGAREAERIGLVNRVVASDRLQEEAYRLAKRIAENSRASVRTIKGLIDRGMETSLAQGLAQELEAFRSFQEKGLPQDTRERLKGYLERRKGSER